jgi:hypothetical protein
MVVVSNNAPEVNQRGIMSSATIINLKKKINGWKVGGHKWEGATLLSFLHPLPPLLSLLSSLPPLSLSLLSPSSLPLSLLSPSSLPLSLSPSALPPLSLVTCYQDGCILQRSKIAEGLPR